MSSGCGQSEIGGTWSDVTEVTPVPLRSGVAPLSLCRDGMPRLPG